MNTKNAEKKKIKGSFLAQFHSNSSLLLSIIDLFREIPKKIFKEICCTQLKKVACA
jgi:hypothetical protein